VLEKGRVGTLQTARERVGLIAERLGGHVQAMTTQDALLSRQREA
jgi:hypothetical protein